MTSPLDGYINSRIIINVRSGEVSQVNGRLSNSNDIRYLILGFLKRSQSSGTSTGVISVPKEGSRSRILPGYDGQVFLYRGYGLRYCEVSNEFDVGSSISGLTFTEMTTRPNWLTNGVRCELLFGEEMIKAGELVISSGTYGSAGIDEIIIKEIGGIALVISGSEYVV